ncbi:MAG: TRAP transporter large permease subunit [Candidatus Auribacterota bacterium]
MIPLLLIAAALIGLPLFCVIGGIAIYSFINAEIDSSAIIIEMVRLASAPMLLAIPLFTFTGYVLAESKAPERMVNLSRALFGWMPGGVPIVVIITCALFTAFTGASGVTIIALGGLLYPILLAQKYSEDFSIGLITSAGCLGLLIPPSLPLILYGVVSETPIDRLFMAGVIPNLLLIVLLSLYSIRKGFIRNKPRTPFSWKELIRTIKEAAFEIPLPILVLGGIYSGIFTATEAAAISAVYAVIVEVFVYKDISIKKGLPDVMVKSMVLVGSILIILSAALGFANYLIDAEVPMTILGWMSSFITSKLVFLMFLNIFLLIVGCLLDVFSAIIVVVPLIKPIALNFGVDPIHLGIIFLVNLSIGYCTPPIGINLFIATSRFNKPILQVYKATIPFLIILLAGLLIITYVPQLSLGLEQLVFANK